VGGLLSVTVTLPVHNDSKFTSVLEKAKDFSMLSLVSSEGPAICRKLERQGYANNERLFDVVGAPRKEAGTLLGIIRP
jgi:hypothetical protein